MIRADEIDDPLAHEPPRLVSAEWDGQQLTLILDREVSQEWIEALHNMGSHSSLYGKPPEAFTFRGNQASIDARENDVQPVIDHFKVWLPKATQMLKYRFEQAAARQKAEREEKLRREREAEERRLRVMRNIEI